MDRRVVALLAATAVVASLLAGAATPALADHGGRSNYTVVPHDPQPGEPRATYEQHATSPVDFQYLDYIRATWADGDFSKCSAANSERFGIDRNGDAPGVRTDESLSQYVEESKITEDVFLADFYEKDDAIGSSTYLNAGDEFVSLTSDCFGNPSEPGWYQIQSSIGGTLANGTYVEAKDLSHYFYVCDCGSYREAVNTLGPPPSAETPTPTPTASPTPTPEPTPTASPTPTRTPPDEGTPFPSPTPSPTPTATDSPTDAPTRADVTTARATATRAGAASEPTDAPGGGGSVADDGTPTPTPEGWDSIAKRTPTVGSGPGFGPVVALVGLLAAAVLAVRR